MELEMKVMDQFVNEEGSEQERKCWKKIRSAMCEANSKLGEGWLDAKKELPQNSYGVIVCDDEGYIYIGYYSSEGWIRDCGEDLYNVIAWMPLSEIGKPAFA